MVTTVVNDACLFQPIRDQIFSVILNNPKSSFGSRFISFNIFAKRVGSSYRKYSTDLISLFSEFA